MKKLKCLLGNHTMKAQPNITLVLEAKDADVICIEQGCVHCEWTDRWWFKDTSLLHLRELPDAAKEQG